MGQATTTKTAKTGAAADVVFIGYVGGLGGEAIQPLELASGLAARGARVTMVVPALPKVADALHVYRDRPGLTLIETPLIRYDTFAQNPSDVLKLLAPLRSAPVLHLHTGDIALPRMTLFALEALRPRHVFATIHCANEEMAHGGGRARYWASAANRLFQKIICPSAHGRRTQIGYGVRDDKSVTIYNGVDVARYAGGDGAGPRRALHIADDTPLVVFTSRLHEQKRPLDALNAFALVAGEFRSAHFALVGDGPLEQACRARVRELGLEARVHFVGHQNNVPDWLAASTVWALPSDAENFSLAVIEALAAGCAVVANWCRGNDEILKPGENALTAPVGDVAAFADGLRRLLATPDLRARLRTSAQATAQNFSRDKMVDMHELCYKGMPLPPNPATGGDAA